MKRLFLRLGVWGGERAEIPNSDKLMAEIVDGLRRLAFGENNDLLRLAGCPGGDSGRNLEECCLYHVKRLKLSKDGALEAEFADRYRAIQLLLEITLQQKPGPDATGFYTALENAARALERTENGCDSSVSAKSS